MDKTDITFHKRIGHPDQIAMHVVSSKDSMSVSFTAQEFMTLRDNVNKAWIHVFGDNRWSQEVSAK